MRFLFVHAWGGFSLAEWYLRDALDHARAQVELRSYDMPVTGVPIDDTLPRILVTWKPDVVGFSCHYWSIRAFLEAASHVRRLRPEATVVLGGPQVASGRIAERVLTEHPAVDYVLRGRAERSLVQLVDGIAGRADLAAISGLSWRQHGLTRHNPLEGSKRPRRTTKIFHRENQALTDYLTTAREASYETVIGCRARCVYCVYPTGRLELVDDTLVRAELAYLCSLDIPYIRISDAHFAGVKDRAKMLLRHLRRINRRSSIKLYPDLRHVDAEYIDLLREADADPTSIGVQSTNPAALETIRRRPVQDRLAELRTLLEAFPNTPADVIVGLPSDTPEGLERTLRDLVSLGFRRVNAFRLHLFPGTALGDDPAAFPDMADVLQTDTGQVLTSRGFPTASLEHVASLVHAAEIVMPLVQTRNLLARIGLVDRLIDLATRLQPDVLLELRSRMAAFHPVRLVRGFEDTVATIASGLGVTVEQPRLVEAVQLDLLEYLRANCADRHIRDFLWDADAHGRRIRRVELELLSHRTAVWDLPEATIRFSCEPPPGDGHDRHLLGPTALPRPEATPTC